QEGGTVVRRLQGDIATLNPVMAQSVNDRQVDYYLHAPMVHFDADLSAIPGLAEKWEISSDGRLYTLHLNPTATFSDGSNVTAGEEILLERRPEYWGPRPNLQRVLFKVIADDITAWNAMKRGEIDETIISTDTWLAEGRRPELQKFIDFRRFYTLNYNYIAWNN